MKQRKRTLTMNVGTSRPPFLKFASYFLSLSLLTAAGGCVLEEEELSPEIGKVEQPAYVAGNKIWNSGDIPVCWENPGSYATERLWVRRQIEATWEEAAAIDFLGWGTCESSSDGIRIRIRDEASAPHVEAFGDDLDGLRNGMVLNFEFTQWDGVGDTTDATDGTCATDARREDCIRFIAVHEFGHALGFYHEQERPDTPTSCVSDTPAGNSGGVEIGAWDADSVMNYCNIDWNNDGVLSSGDISAARAYYPGNVHMHALRWNGTVGAYTDSWEWTNGWTTTEPFNVGTREYLFLLKRSNGIAHVRRLNSDGSLGSLAASYDWSSGWTSAQFFTSGSTTYMMILKEGNGIVHIHRMNSNGSVGTRVAKYDWSGGWSNVKIGRIGSNNYLFLLKRGTGDVHIHRMNSNGTVGTRVFDRKWGSGWDTTEFFSAGGNNYLFLMKSGTGDVHIQRMNSNGTVGSNVLDTRWSRGWTSTTMYQVGTTPYMMILKEGTGDVHIHRMNTSGTVGTRMFDSKWRPGWSNAEAFYVDGSPYMFLLMDG